MNTLFKARGLHAPYQIKYGYYTKKDKEHMIVDLAHDTYTVVDIETLGQQTGMIDFDGICLYTTDEVIDRDRRLFKIAYNPTFGCMVLTDTKYGIEVQRLTQNYIQDRQLRKMGE